VANDAHIQARITDRAALSVTLFKSGLDKFWADQKVLFDY